MLARLINFINLIKVFELYIGGRFIDYSFSFMDCIFLTCIHRSDSVRRQEFLLTGLKMAAVSNSYQHTKTLIYFGANINAKLYDKLGCTAIHFAADCGHLEVVKELIKAGADVNIQNKVDATALHSAVKLGNLEIVKELIKAGADVNIRTIDGSTALHSAVKLGNLEIVKELIKAGADINIKNTNGETVLNYAISYSKEPLTYLIKTAHFADQLIKTEPDYDVQSQSFNELIATKSYKTEICSNVFVTTNVCINEFLSIVYQRIVNILTDKYVKGDKIFNRKALETYKSAFVHAELILSKLKESHKETFTDQTFKGDMDSFIEKLSSINKIKVKLMDYDNLGKLILSEDQFNFLSLASTGESKINVFGLKDYIASYLADDEKKENLITAEPKKVIARFDSLSLKEKAAIISVLKELEATDYPLNKIIPGLKFCFKGFEKSLSKAFEEDEASTIVGLENAAKATEAPSDIEAEVADVGVYDAGAALLFVNNAAYDRAKADEMPLLEPLFEHSTLGDDKED